MKRGEDMKYDFLGVSIFGLVFLIGLSILITFITLGIYLIKALIRYNKSADIRKEKSNIKKSLGEVLRQHREDCKMTQQFVAEGIGISRQAVSKWENGTSDPSTSNLIALAKLFHVSVEDMLEEVK